MMQTAFPQQVRIVEVGPRDGLQNESKILPSSTKIELISRLVNCGISHIEAGSFVNPQRIPQLADSDAVFAGIAKAKSLTYSALVPNVQGMERAIASGVDVPKVGAQMLVHKYTAIELDPRAFQELDVRPDAGRDHDGVRFHRLAAGKLRDELGAPCLDARDARAGEDLASLVR